MSKLQKKLEIKKPRLKEYYEGTVRLELKKNFSYRSVNEIPLITKIVVNMGVGKAAADKKIIGLAASDMTLITGQKPCVTHVKKSNAGFKIREGWPIGCKVTLRKNRMYEFLDRLISVAIPRIRDFRGFSPRSFDGRGNYSLGIHEQIVFPEIKYDTVDTLRGMDITIVTTAKTDKEGRALLAAFEFPFKEN